MTATPTERAASISAQLGVTERIFASPAMKRLISSVDDGLIRIEESLAQTLTFTDPVADSTGRYLLEAGGKRVRPMLILLTAHLGRGVTPEVIRAAEGIEITHLGSLYHDDVMDEADRRRGVPAAHAVWGNSVAILTGDLLFARASQIMGELGERAVKLQADTFERLVLGQLHETVGPQPGEDIEEHYIQVLADKTGSLIAAAAKSGVVFGGGDEDFVEPVTAYGEAIGIAFQLADDIIDMSPNPEETGKVPGTDLRQGVQTLPLIRLRREAEGGSSSAAALVERFDAAVHEPDSLSDADFDRAVTELREHEVTRSTRAEAQAWAARAVAALTTLPAGPVKESLTRFTDTVVDRSS